MAAKYIELEQAAKKLGITTDELNNMRLSGEIHGVRDGSSWKFKSDELDRVAEERSVGSPGGESVSDLDLDFGTSAPEGSSDLHLDLDAEDLDDSPTTIGKAADLDEPHDAGSDLELASSAPKAAGKTPKKSTGTSDLGFDVESESDIRLVADDIGSEVNLVASDSGDVLGGTDVGLETGGAGTGDLDFEGSDLTLGSDISFDSEDKPASAKFKPESKSPDSDVTIGDSEEIALDEDDELVLDGGSGIGRAAGDTGINLTSPSDSGLNLEEEPLDLAGSSVSSLELPEDEDLLDLEDLDAESEPGTPAQVDEDFQLAPSATLQDDEEDSGSQVIALEDSSAFGVPLEGEVEGEALLTEEAQPDEFTGDLKDDTAPVTLPTVQLGAAQDLPYSIWNVLSLLVIVVVLSITGMLMTDMVRNMWTWDETFTASTPIMDVMVRMFGLQP